MWEALEHLSKTTSRLPYHLTEARRRNRLQAWTYGITLLSVGVCAAVCIPDAQAQVFDVASVKVRMAPLPPAGGSITVSGSRITIEGYSIFGLIMYAYGIRQYQVTDWRQMNQTPYDIVAQIEDGRNRTREEFRPYVENLLLDRFKLQVHWEEKEQLVYALVVSKAGVKFKESAPDTKRSFVGTAISRTALGREMTFSGFTMEEFTDMIRNSDGLDHLVMDQTGLTGRYDIKVAYLAQNRMSGPPPGMDDIDIFTALPRQLGLELVQRKAMVKLIVVDHSERPSEN
jgi:uncharacterized protein (TIGR03435 family)